MAFATLRDRDQAFLTEIGKLGADIANDVGGSQAIQAAVVEAVMIIMSEQDVERRSTYQQKLAVAPAGNTLKKRSL